MVMLAISFTTAFIQTDEKTNTHQLSAISCQRFEVDPTNQLRFKVGRLGRSFGGKLGDWAPD